MNKHLKLAVILAILLFMPAVVFGQSSVAGSNTEIQFNDNGEFGASPTLTWNKAMNQLRIMETDGYWPSFYTETRGVGFAVGGRNEGGPSISVSNDADPIGTGTAMGIQIGSLFRPTESNKFYYGLFSIPAIAGSQAIDTVAGVLSAPLTSHRNSQAIFTGSLKNLISFDAQSMWTNGSVENLVGFRFVTPTVSESGRSANVRNAYGVLVQDVKGAQNKNVAIKTGLGVVTFGDNVGIGTEEPKADLHVVATTKNSTTTAVFGKAGSQKGTCITYYDTAGQPHYQYFVPGVAGPVYSLTKPEGCEN
jgi:hypothetical protein